MDKVDAAFLARSVRAFEEAIDRFDDMDASAFRAPDPNLWRLAATNRFVAKGLQVDLTLHRADGTPAEMAVITGDAMVDDFTPAWSGTTVTDAAGHASMLVPDAVLTMGSASRWLHLRSGEDYPLTEHIIALHRR